MLHTELLPNYIWRTCIAEWLSLFLQEYIFSWESTCCIHDQWYNNMYTWSTCAYVACSSCFSLSVVNHQRESMELARSYRYTVQVLLLADCCIVANFLYSQHHNSRNPVLIPVQLGSQILISAHFYPHYLYIIYCG